MNREESVSKVSFMMGELFGIISTNEMQEALKKSGVTDETLEVLTKGFGMYHQDVRIFNALIVAATELIKERGEGNN